MTKPLLLDSWATAEIRARDAVIEDQEGIISSLESDVAILKTRGRAALQFIEAQARSIIRAVANERDYYRDAYETVIKLFGINGGGGKVTLLRANWIIDFLLSIEGREYGQWKASGRRFLTVDEVQRLLTDEIDEVLRLSPELKHPRLAAANVLRRVIKEAARRGIPIRKVTGGRGPKYLILEYIPGGKPPALEEPRKRGRPGKTPDVVKAVLESGRKLAGWAANYTGFVGKDNRYPEG